MYLNLLNVFKGDKSIEHPVLGQMSCTSLQEAYRHCLNFIDNHADQQRQCRTYYDIAINCFQSRSTEEFRQILEDKIQERKRLREFLQSNQSKLLELQQQNSEQQHNFFSPLDTSQQQSEQQLTNFYAQQQQKNKPFL